jgi:hypothetical protein
MGVKARFLSAALAPKYVFKIDTSGPQNKGVARSLECPVPLQPGDFWLRRWEGGNTDDLTKADSLAFVCPASDPSNPVLCGGGHGILIGIPGKPPESPSWAFNGDLQNPSLSPSVNCTGGCRWHGYLTNGIWNGQKEG